MAAFDVTTNTEPIGLLGATSVTITNAAGDTLYYGDNRQVSAASNLGSLTSGNSVTVTEAVWVVSASRSSVTVSYTYTQASSSGGSGASSTGSLPVGTEPAAAPAADQNVTAPWNPEKFTRGYEIDALQASYAADEQSLIAEGSLLYSDCTGIGNPTRSAPAIVRPGPFGRFRPSFQQLGPYGVPSFPLDGSLSHDNTGWALTVDVAVDPSQAGAVDFYNLSSQTPIFGLLSGKTGVSKLYKSGASLLGFALQNAENTFGVIGPSVSSLAQITLTAPIVTTANMTGTAALSAITGTTQPVVGTLVTGRGIPPFTYVTSAAGVSGAWTCNLSQSTSLTLTATNVTFSDIPLATAQQASQTANGTTASASNSVTAWAGAAIVPGMGITGAGIPNNTYVQAYSAGTITLSQNATASATVALTVTDYPIQPSMANGGGGFCPLSSVATSWDGVTTNYYPLVPFAPISVVYNPGVFTSSPVAGTLSLVLGNGRKSASQNISQTANGTVSGSTVTNWAGTSGNLAPTAGMLVYGNGIPAGTTIASVAGSTGAYTLNLSLPVGASVTSSGTQAITVSQNLMPRPWGSDTLMVGQGSGAVIGTTSGTGTAGPNALWVTAPEFLRWPRIANQNQGIGVPVDSITVDWATTGLAVNPDLYGVVAKYTGDGLTEALETATAVRDQQIAWAVAVGILRRRETEWHGRSVPTITGMIGTGTVAAGSNQITGFAAQAPQTANGTLSTATGSSGGLSWGGSVTGWLGTNAPPLGSAVTGTNVAASSIVVNVTGSSGNWTLYLNNTPTGTGLQSITVTSPAVTNGMTIAGAGIPWGTTIQSGAGTATLTLSQSTIASQTASATMNGTTTVTGFAGTVAPTIGSQVSGVNIAASTTVANVTGGSGNYTITLSQAASGSGTNSITITPAASGVSLAGGSISLTTTDLFARWDRWHTRYGGTAGSQAPTAYRIHGLLGYTPTNFTATNTVGGANVPPAIAGYTDQQVFALYGTYLSKTVIALQQRYPTHFDRAGFWNEPSQSVGTWTIVRFQQSWAASAAQIAADQTTNGTTFSVGGVEEGWNGNINGTNNSNFQVAVMQAAQTWGLALPWVTYHSYDEGQLPKVLEVMLALKNQASSNGGFTPKRAITELDLTNYGARETAYNRFGREPIVGPNSVHQPAFLHAVNSEFTQIEPTGMITYFTLGQFQLPGIGQTGANAYIWSAALTQQNPPSVTPMGSLLWLLCKLAGNYLNVSSNVPGVRLTGSISGSVRTIIWSSWQPHKPGDLRQIQLQSSNLPASFGWKQWRYDYRDRGDGRLLEVARGNQSNFPRAIDTTHVGIGAMQITG